MVRMLDIVLAGFALIVLSPLLLVSAAILKFTGEGEVFFLQERVGRFGKTFKLIKFATMLKHSPHMATGTITVKDDPRILPVGRFLRKTKINELTQLMNVVLGDMSLIGPRPLTPSNFSLYTEELQREVASVQPGLSGVGSIVFRNEEDIMQGESATREFYRDQIAPYKGRLEKWFVRRKGLAVYLSCLVLTVHAVIFPRSGLIWRVFKDLPVPPDALKASLNH